MPEIKDTGKTAAAAAEKTPTTSGVIPVEIVDVVIAELRNLHNCTSCFTHDLISLSLVNKAFNKSAAYQIFTKISIHRPRTFTYSNGNKEYLRFKLLNRTLRKRPHFGLMVQKLDLGTWDFIHDADVIANIIVSCPNLQVYRGTDCTQYNGAMHLPKRGACICKMILAKKNLKEYVRVQTDAMESANITNKFLSDIKWQNLDTLVLGSALCNSGASSSVELAVGSGDDKFLKLFSVLGKSLRRLYIAGISSAAFTNDILAKSASLLPRLEALRIQHVEGITMGGIVRWVNALPDYPKINSLSITGINRHEYVYPSEFCELFSKIPDLKRFVFRSICPCGQDLSDSDSFPAFQHLTNVGFQPVLKSPKLEFLHWDVKSHRISFQWLRYSLLAGGLPKLKALQIKFEYYDSISHTIPIRSLCSTVKAPDESLMRELVKNAAQFPYSSVYQEYIFEDKYCVAMALPNYESTAELVEWHLENVPREYLEPYNGVSLHSEQNILQFIRENDIALDISSCHPLSLTQLLEPWDLPWIKNGQPPEEGRTHWPWTINPDGYEYETEVLDQAVEYPCDGSWNENAKTHIPRRSEIADIPYQFFSINKFF